MGRDETKSIAISMVNGTMYYDVGVVVGVGVGVGVEGIDRVCRCLLAVVLCVFSVVLSPVCPSCRARTPLHLHSDDH